MTSEAQKRASANYKKRSTKQTVVTFYPADMDLYEWLCAQPKRAAYIRELIRKDKQARKGLIG